MKRIYIHIVFLLAVSVVLTACDSDENWFIRTIEYNGKVDKAELVVIGELYVGDIPVIYVSESVFFNDPEYRKKIRSTLTDANVQLTVNDDAPIKMRYKRITNADHTITGTYYTDAYSLREGDRLVFTVRHPNYEKTARASLQVPAAPKVEIAFQDTTWGINGQDWAGLAHWRVGLQPATGRHDSYLIFQSMCHRTYEYYERYDYNSQPQVRYDVDKRIVGYTYAKDPSFAECPAINLELGEGYWGAADPLGLYCPTPTTAKDVDVYGYYERTEIREHTYNDGDYYYRQSWLTDSIELTVCATSDEQYYYLGSLINSGNYYRRYVTNFWGDDYEGDIEDVFSGLGSLEGVQIFGNVENGIGHITAFSHPTRQVIYPNND